MAGRELVPCEFWPRVCSVVLFIGPSSIGKTLALRVAGSVWGGGGLQGFVNRWRSTLHGVEALAERHCDNLLILDELSEVNASDAARAIYVLANGCGKQRCDRSGNMLPAKSWRVLFLSSGEVSLATHLDAWGERTRGGHSVRLVEIEVDAGSGYGILDDAGSTSPSLFVERLRLATTGHYGVAARHDLEALCRDRDSVLRQITAATTEFMAAVGASQLPRQVQRVARRFALIHSAGGLASQMGILPCPQKAILHSVQTCFRSWAESRVATADFETHQIVTQIRQYLQTFGHSHFRELSLGRDQGLAGKCAGFKQRSAQGEHAWFVLSEVFCRDVCKGLEARRVTAVLKQLGLLVAAPDGKSSKTMRLPGLGTTRVYHLSEAILSAVV